MNKSAIITGASRGIGCACAHTFAKAGYNLSLCCLNNIDSLNKMASDLSEKYNIKILTFQGDAGDYNFANNMVQKTLDTFGNIDILINNAGMSHIGLLQDMTPLEWDKIISTNLTSVFNFCKNTIHGLTTTGKNY